MYIPTSPSKKQVQIPSYLPPKNDYSIYQPVQTKQVRSFSPKPQQSNQKQILAHFEYSFQDLIGRGYSSKVFKGVDINTKSDVAVKVISTNNLTEINRILLDQEIEALTKLKHQNIINVYEILKDVNHIYIITEYCEYGDLNKIIKEHQKIPEKIARQIFKGIVSGWLYLVRNGYIHRDLKPANILFTGKLLKIADFGFAVNFSQTKEKGGMVIGTPLYMSPECLKKNKYDEKTDIWALGIIYYEMLHGVTPYLGSDENSIYQNMMKKSLNLNKDLSDNVKQILAQILQIDPQSRLNSDQLEIMLNLKPPTPHSHYVQIVTNNIQKNFPTQSLRQVQSKPFTDKVSLEAKQQICNYWYIQAHKIDNLEISSFLMKEKIIWILIELLHKQSIELNRLAISQLSNNAHLPENNVNENCSKYEFYYKSVSAQLQKSKIFQIYKSAILPQLNHEIFQLLQQLLKQAILIVNHQCHTELTAQKFGMLQQLIELYQISNIVKDQNYELALIVMNSTMQGTRINQNFHLLYPSLRKRIYDTIV